MEDSPLNPIDNISIITPAKDIRSGLYLPNSQYLLISNLEYETGIVVDQKTLKMVKKFDLKTFDKK